MHDLKACTERRNWTELTWFSFRRTDQWVSNNALQLAPFNGVGGLRDYAHVRVNRLPMVGQCVENSTVSVQFSYVALYAPLKWWRAINWCCTCRDIEETTKLVDESQKVFEVNPWDFEPDFFPVAGIVSSSGMFRHTPLIENTACIIAFTYSVGLFIPFLKWIS